MLNFGSPSPVRSMAPEEDGLMQSAAAANHATFYTATDYTGKGILVSLGLFHELNIAYLYPRVTSDGNSMIWDVDGISEALMRCYSVLYNASNLWYSAIPFHLEFKSSLKVEIANDYGSASSIGVQVFYSIMSKEFNREIINAGQPLPDRGYTYPFDVMVVWFTGEYGVSNKIQFPQEPKMSLHYDNDGFLQGQLRTAVFNNDVKAQSRYIWEDLPDDKVQAIRIDDVVYNVPLIKGKFDSRDFPEIPKKPGSQVINL